MSDRRARVVRLVWESAGQPPWPPPGQPAELEVPWPESIPLPVRGELLELEDRSVLEYVESSFGIRRGADAPVLCLLCRPAR